MNRVYILPDEITAQGNVFKVYEFWNSADSSQKAFYTVNMGDKLSLYIIYRADKNRKTSWFTRHSVIANGSLHSLLKMDPFFLFLDFFDPKEETTSFQNVLDVFHNRIASNKFFSELSPLLPTFLQRPVLERYFQISSGAFDDSEDEDDLLIRVDGNRIVDQLVVYHNAIKPLLKSKLQVNDDAYVSYETSLFLEIFVPQKWVTAVNQRLGIVKQKEKKPAFSRVEDEMKHPNLENQ
ncbi:hypothetical protein PCE1_001456 [Barthelona sp. PCE]